MNFLYRLDLIFCLECSWKIYRNTNFNIWINFHVCWHTDGGRRPCPAVAKAVYTCSGKPCLPDMVTIWHHFRPQQGEPSARHPHPPWQSMEHVLLRIIMLVINNVKGMLWDFTISRNFKNWQGQWCHLTTCNIPSFRGRLWHPLITPSFRHPTAWRSTFK